MGNDSTAPRQATWNSATAQNTSLASLSFNYATALVTFQSSGTITGGTIVFEGFDGTNWYSILATEVLSGASDQSFALSGSSTAWFVNVTAFTQFRVRLSSAITGSGNALITITQSTMPTSLSIGSGTQEDVNLNQVGGASFGLGQTTRSNSLPVTMASDQTAFPVTANAGTNLNTSTLALEAGGNLATIVADLTNGTQQTKITDGTNLLSMFVPGTPNSSVNAIPSAATTESHAFSVSAVQAGTTYDAGNYASVKVQILTQYTGTTPTINFQTSNDGVNWVSQVLLASTQGSGTAANNTTSTGIFYGALTGRYFRLNFTGAYVSGAATGTIVFSTQTTSPQSMGVVNAWISSATSGSITTSASSIVSSSLSGYGGYALVSIHGTHSGISFGITVSDDSGTTFYSVPIYDTAANQWLAPGATITPGTNASKWYWVPIPPSGSQVKVLASAYTSGTGTIRISHAGTAVPGSTMSQLMDAAGNNRGANVNANNELAVIDQGIRPAGTALNNFSIHLTTNTTTTPTSSTCYISSIAISNEVGGTTSSLTIQDKQGTPLKLVNGLATTALTTAPTIITFDTPVKMVSGIDIITAGAVAATVDVWVNYYQ